MSEMAAVHSTKEGLNKVMEELNKNDVTKVVMVGKAGVGKTWMARKLSDLAVRKGGFRFSIWLSLNRDKILLGTVQSQLSLVCASEEWEAHSGIEEGIKKGHGQKLVSIKRKITETLEDEKVLIILEDEGNQMKENEVMEQLRDLLPQNQQVSYKYVITRNEYIKEPIHEEKIINVEALDAEESLCLVLQKVGRAILELPGVEDFAKFFIGKSRKFPSEILVIAKALSYFSQSESGIKMLEYAKEQAVMADNQDYNVMQLLSSGYHALPSSILIDCCLIDTHFLKSKIIHYNELISYWMLEGYLGQFDSIESAYEKGYSILSELLDCGLLKKIEASYVSINGAKFKSDVFEDCRYLEAVNLGLAYVFDGELGRIAWTDGMMKTVCPGEEQKQISTLLLDGNNLNREVPNDFLQSKKELEVFAIFNPTFELLPLPLFEMQNLRLLVLRGCDCLENIDEALRYNEPIISRVPDTGSGHTQKNKVLNSTKMADAKRNHIQEAGTSALPQMSTPSSVLKKLTVLEISGAKLVKSLPDQFFLHMPHLRSLNLSSLQIESLPSSINNLEGLAWLILRGCSQIMKLTLRSFRKLEVLDCSGATSLTEFREKSFSSNKQLRVLNLSQSRITQLPLIHEAVYLTHIILRDCTELRRLPRIETLSKLRFLDLSGCTNCLEIHDPSFQKLVNLEVFNASLTKVSRLPSHISNPHHLCLSGCSRIEELHYKESFKHLEVLDLSACSNLKNLEEKIFDFLKYLRVLNLSETAIEILPSLSNLSNLRQLLVSHCLSLKKLGKLGSLTKLEVLNLSGCNSLTEIQDKSFKDMNQLQKIDFSGSSITCLPSLSGLGQLRHLLLKSCASLKALPSFQCLGSLEHLNLSGVRLVGEIGTDFLMKLTNLQILDLSETNLKLLPSLACLRNLNYLSVKGCWHLSEVPGLEELIKLEFLDLSSTAVKDLPPLDKFSNLQRLLLKDCSSLEQFKYLEVFKVMGLPIEALPYGISKLTALEHLELPKMKIQGIDALTTIFPPEQSDHLKWYVSYWPTKALMGKSKLGIPIEGIQFVQLLEKNRLLWDSIFSSSHFLVCPAEAQIRHKNEHFYANELSYRDIYFQSRQLSGQKKRERSLEIHGFDYFPEHLGILLAHSEYIFLINNPFIRCLFDLGVENIKRLKACWTERCSNMENFVHMDKVSDTSASGQKLENEGNMEENNDILAKMADNLEILSVFDAPNLKSVFTGNFNGRSFKSLKCLSLEYCPKLSNVCPTSKLLENLENLQVKFCDNLEALFEESASIPKLQILHLWALPKLKSTAYVVPNLQTLNVGECSMLVNIFSSAQYPEHLKTLLIKFCDNLETIFEQGQSTLHELQKLHLWNLPKLKKIGVDLPALADLKIRGCSELPEV